MEVAHLQGKVDQLEERQGPEVPATYASVLAAAGALARSSASNREGLDRLKSAIESDEAVRDILTPKFPVRFRPQYRVTGVDTSVTRETAFLKLKEQNSLEITKGAAHRQPDADFHMRGGCGIV
ncbi:hypothetical protein HPB47_003516 [Ixodes persulcatus]|uniref:Uncharacterized protein n=1 Tax=Ixodes persulcatus TaxID=34615 RepID=A0AC60PIB4_IXOPE|nr:hypothetical protein HPB47_003516 [Ixodes persulcatus]